MRCRRTRALQAWPVHQYGLIDWKGASKDHTTRYQGSTQIVLPKACEWRWSILGWIHFHNMSCQKAASTAESVQTLMSLVYCVTNLQCAVNAYVSRPQHCRLHLGPALDTFLSCLQQHHYNCKRGNIYCDLMYHHSWSTIVPTRVISKIPCSYVSLLSTLEVLAKKNWGDAGPIHSPHSHRTYCCQPQKQQFLISFSQHFVGKAVKTEPMTLKTAAKPVLKAAYHHQLLQDILHWQGLHRLWVLLKACLLQSLWPLQHCSMWCRV